MATTPFKRRLYGMSVLILKFCALTLQICTLSVYVNGAVEEVRSVFTLVRCDEWPERQTKQEE